VIFIFFRATTAFFWAFLVNSMNRQEIELTNEAVEHRRKLQEQLAAVSRQRFLIIELERKGKDAMLKRHALHDMVHTLDVLLAEHNHLVEPYPKHKRQVRK
jgi:hypothetical protein